MSREPRERFQSLLESFSTGMLVTHGPDGGLDARPMRVARVESDGDLWFVTKASSGKVRAVRYDAGVAVVFQGGGKYLTVCGKASVTRGPDRVAELWNESWRVWFPGGQDDPSLTLLHVNATHGEYWDNSGLQGLQYAIRAGQAYWTGETPEIPDDVNAEVKLG